MQSFWQMLTTTLGSAAAIAALSTVFFSLGKISKLQQKNKVLYSIILAVLFGLFSMYASASAVKVDGALCNCRNLAPLYAGFVGGPVAGIGAALIGGLFRYFVYGGASAVPCMLACFIAGVVGSVLYLIVKKECGLKVLIGICASVFTELCHMGLLCLFGQGELAGKIALPMIIANVCGIAFCIYIQKNLKNAD